MNYTDFATNYVRECYAMGDSHVSLAGAVVEHDEPFFTPEHLVAFVSALREACTTAKPRCELCDGYGSVRVDRRYGGTIECPECDPVETLTVAIDIEGEQLLEYASALQAVYADGLGDPKANEELRELVASGRVRVTREPAGGSALNGLPAFRTSVRAA